MRIGQIALCLVVLALPASRLLGLEQGSPVTRECVPKLRVSAPHAPFAGADGNVAISLALHNDGSRALSIHYGNLPWVKMSGENLLVFRDGERVSPEGLQVGRPYGEPLSPLDVLGPGEERSGMTGLSHLPAGRYELVGLVPCEVRFAGETQSIRVFLPIPHLSFEVAKSDSK
ncbi:MAG: hypothetical protein PVJ57_06975 [Phycisphaerae bacterium]|jgi:hypothetical protein